jgi:hypothetical protein
MSLGVAFKVSAKSVVIEVVVGFLELVAEPIIGVFKVDTLRRYCQLSPYVFPL